jgi:hypothetical protein
MLLVWVILTATACTGKCAVDLQPAPFVPSGLHIRKAFAAAALSDRLTDCLFVNVFADHAPSARKIRQHQERSSTAWTPGGWFQQSRHAPTVADQHYARNDSLGSGISKLGRQTNGGLSTEKDNL